MMLCVAGFWWGIFNAIQDFDRTLHEGNGLKDVYLEAGGIEGAEMEGGGVEGEKGWTWGMQSHGDAETEVWVLEDGQNAVLWRREVGEVGEDRKRGQSARGRGRGGDVCDGSFGVDGGSCHTVVAPSEIRYHVLIPTTATSQVLLASLFK